MSASNRRGYAYLWVVATVATIAVLAAAAAPYIDQSADVIAVKRTSEILHELSGAVDSFQVYVKTAPTKHATPYLLNQLTTTRLVSGDPGGCTSVNFNNAAVTAWDGNAPFSSIYVPVGGLWTPLGEINDSPSKTDTAASVRRTGNRDDFYIQIPNVDYELAKMLDLYIDGTLNGAADTVRYTAPDATGRTLVSYLATPTLPAC